MFNYIPYFIKENMEKKNGFFKTYCIFLDTEGFSTITEKFMEMGKNGAEALSKAIGICTSPIADSIYMNGGFISSIEGDSFTALFPECDFERVCQSLKDIITSLEILSVYNRSVKIGIGYGIVEWGILGIEHKTFYFKGEAIDKAIRAQKKAGSNEIIFHEETLFNNDIVTLEKIEENYYKLLKIDNQINLKSDYRFDQVDYKTSNEFYPEAVLRMNATGEFREVVSLFIKFPDGMDFYALNDFVTIIIEKTDFYGGYFNCIDFSDKGGYVFINFGAPISYEDNIERACEYVLDVFATFENLELRAGMSYGLTYSGIIGNERRKYYSCVGTITNLAARMMQKATVKEILVSEIIYEKTKNKFHFSGKRSIQFKGFSEQVCVYNLESKNYNTFELNYEGEYINRIKEKEIIKNRFKKLDEGKNGGFVIVAGEAGIGKSRFVYEILKETEYQIFYMKCDNISRAGFKILKNFFKEYFGYNIDDFEKNYNILLKKIEEINVDNNLKNDFLEGKKYFAYIIDIIMPGIMKEEPPIRYNKILLLIKIFFKIQSLISGTIIIIEDIHRIDNETIDFLNKILTEADNYPYMVIATSRYNEDNEIEIKYVNNSINIEIIELKKLNETDIFNLIKSRTKNALPDFLQDYIVKNTEGNPFYIEEYIKYLDENELFDDDEIFMKMKEKYIPQNIKNIIVSRVDKMPLNLKMITEIASVLGYEFDIGLISELTGIRDIKYYLTIGESYRLWEPIDKRNYRFRHDLIRESVYSMQLGSRVQVIHKIAAEKINKIYYNKKEKYPELAYHYEKAGEKNKAREYLLETAKIAKKDYRNNEVISIYKKILLLSSEKEEIQIYNELGHVYINIGKYSLAFDSFYKAHEISEKYDLEKEKAEGYYNLGFSCYYLEEKDKALEFYFEGLKLIDNEVSDDRIEMLLYSGIAAVYLRTGKYEEALKYYKLQLGIASKLMDKLTITAAFSNMGSAYWEMNERKKAEEYYLKAYEVSKELQSKKIMATVLTNLANIYFMVYHDHDKAKKCYLEQYKVYKELNYIRGLSLTILNLIQLKVGIGEFDGVETLIEELKNISDKTNEKHALAQYYKLYGDLLYYKRDLEKAIDNYKKAVENFENIKLDKNIINLLYRLIESLLKADRIEEAEKYLEKINNSVNYTKNSEPFFLKQSINVKYWIRVDKKEAEKLMEEIDFNNLTERVHGEYYEIKWEITGEESFKLKALNTFKDYYEKTKRYFYKLKYDELSKK